MWLFYGLLMKSFTKHFCNGWRNGITLGLELVTCDGLDYCHCQIVSVSYFSSYQGALFFICSGATCFLFTVTQNQGLLLTGPPLHGIHLLVFNVFVIYATAYWLKPGCLSNDRTCDREKYMEAGTNKGAWYESVSAFDAVDLSRSSATAQKGRRKTAHCLLYFSDEHVLHCSSRCRKQFKLVGQQACRLPWRP